MIEVVVVLAVLSILAGSAVPLASAARDGERTIAVELELERIAAALEMHYYDHARFPTELGEPDFVAGYVHASVDRRVLLDDWDPAGLAMYGYRLVRDPDRVQLHSRGPDGRDEGWQREYLGIEVHGALPGNRRSRERLLLIHAALEQHLRRGLVLTGDWSTDRIALRLGAEFAADGFGVPFRSQAGGLGVRSAGADRRFDTADDLTL